MSQSSILLDGDLSPELLNDYQHSQFIALDTETMGLNPHRDRLCTVQLYSDKGFGHIIRINGKNTPYLKTLLQSPEQIKVFHYARFDLAFIRHYLGIQVHNFYCTKLASKLARTYSGKHGLKEVLHELLGVELDKSSQMTNWSKAILSEKQLEYALNDVKYLIPAMHLLNEMLLQEKRTHLLQSCLTFLPTLTELDLLGWSESVFSHRD